MLNWAIHRQVNSTNCLGGGMFQEYEFIFQSNQVNVTIKDSLNS